MQALVEHDFMRVKPCRHGTFMYNKNDAFIGRGLERYGEWCEHELELLLPLLRPGMTVLDIGANLGSHTIPFARAVGPRGRVIAFEPQAQVFHMLAGNVAMNALCNVTPIQAGVGAEVGEAKIPLLDPSGTANFGATRIGEGTEDVAIMPVDGMGLRNCHLIKIDVEGMEVDVLRGAAATVAEFQPALFVENNTVERSAEILREIDALGYRAYWHIAPYYNPRNWAGERENIFTRYQPEANVLALPAHVPVTGLPAVLGLADDWRQAAARLIAGKS